MLKKLSIISISLSLAILLLNICAMSCAGTNQQEKKAPKLPPPIPENLAPGTAKIEAEVVRIEEISGSTICTVKVLNVLGYGMTTRPLAPETELAIEVVGSTDEKVDELKKSARDNKWIFVIRSHEQLAPTTGSINWRTINVMKK